MARSSRYEMDMTTGALLPKVLMFSLPLIASGSLPPRPPSAPRAA